jgi:hypothetical protein
VDVNPDRATGWQLLRGEVGCQAPLLSAPPPAGLAGVPGGRAPAPQSSRGTGLCEVCRGPARPGSRHCYHCSRHGEYLTGLLPDVVAPIAYAPKGGQHATNLWLYKSARPGASAARAALSALLLVFLRDHGGCVWQRAGMARPTHAAVVPSRRGRSGAHPLQALVARYLVLPWTGLRLACSEDPRSCDPDPWRFSAERMAGASVLLLDDTWTSGASATSAAAALRLAGARSVALVVLGRHLDATADGAGRFSPREMPFRPGLCAVHTTACSSIVCET